MAALTRRLAAHRRRLEAAGVEFRPRGGPRRHRPGAQVAKVTARLEELAEAGGGGLAAAAGT